MRGYAILEDKEVIPVDLLKWADWLEHNRDKRRVAERLLPSEVRISTVFLGIDHSFSFLPKSRRLWFETMVFGGPLDGELERYETWDEAILGHQEMVKLALKAELE